MRVCAPVLGSEQITNMFQKHLHEEKTLHYGEFINDLVKYLVSRHVYECILGLVIVCYCVLQLIVIYFLGAEISAILCHNRISGKIWLENMPSY